MNELTSVQLVKYIETHAIELKIGYVYESTSGRIAKKIMLELIKAGYADFILLRDDEVSAWWNSLIKAANTAFYAYQEQLRLYELKLSAWEKLSDDERKMLKIRKPIKPKDIFQG